MRPVQIPCRFFWQVIDSVYLCRTRIEDNKVLCCLFIFIYDIVVILSKARGFASRIRTRSRRIPAPSSAFCRPQGVLPVSGGKIGKGTSFTRAAAARTRNAASAAAVRTLKTLCHSDRSRSASDGAVEEPAVRFSLRYSINSCHPERSMRIRPTNPHAQSKDPCTPIRSGRLKDLARTVGGDGRGGDAGIEGHEFHSCRISTRLGSRLQPLR